MLNIHTIYQLLATIILTLATLNLYAQPVDVTTQVGTNIHFTHPRDGEMDMINQGGFHWIRMDLTWQAIEKQHGQYNFDNYDHLISQLQAGHHRVLLILDYGNTLYDNGMAPFTDTGRQAFANFVTAAVSRYKDKAIYWELWNEPNHRFFWKPNPKVDDYIKLAHVVGKLFKDKFPNETLIGPATSRIAFDFLEPCFKAGLLEYFAAVSVHPYRTAAPQTVSSEYQQLRTLINRYKPKDKHIDIISGEWGYSSVWNDFTPEKQGKMITRQWMTNIANDIAFSIWYDWHDDGKSDHDPEHNFGTVKHEYHADRDPVYDPKPAYLAAQAFHSLLKGYHFNKQLALESDNDHLLLFENDNQLILATWTSGTAHTITIPASAGTFSAWDHLGNPLPNITSTERGLELTINDGATYLKPDTQNDLLAVIAAWHKLPVAFTQSAPANLSHTMQISNPTTSPISITAPDQTTHQLAPGQTQSLTIPISIERSDNQPDTHVTICVHHNKVTQKAHVSATNALSLLAMPGSDHSVVLRLTNPSAKPYAGKITVNDKYGNPLGQSQVLLNDGDMETTINLTTTQTMPTAATLLITLTDNDDHRVAQWEQSYDTRLSQQLADGLWKAMPGGDNKIAGTVTMTQRKAPQPSPAGNFPIFAIDYAFDAGTKFAWLMPSNQKIKTLDGQPSYLGMWIYGDENALIPVTRIADATGQKFQPKDHPITQEGWRYVQLPLNNANVWHYGGAKDGIMHYPIEFDSLLIFDTTKRDKPNQGTIYLTMPTLIWEK